MAAHTFQRDARIHQVVDQQHPARQFAAGHGDVLSDVQVALLRARGLAVAAGGQDGQRHVEDARHLVAHAQPAARQAQDLVELPARLMHVQRQACDQAMVFVPGDPQVLVIVRWQVHRFTLCIVGSVDRYGSARLRGPIYFWRAAALVAPQPGGGLLPGQALYG
ncbi:hypothetical protein D3C72_1825910 [compost metagenome]